MAFEYMQWLQDERGVNVRTIGLTIRSIMSAAKFLYHDVSQVIPQSPMVLRCSPELERSYALAKYSLLFFFEARPGEGDRPYSDLEVRCNLSICIQAHAGGSCSSDTLAVN